MDLRQVEQWIHDASTGTGGVAPGGSGGDLGAAGTGRVISGKAHATHLIDQLRQDPSRWSIGLQLFFHGSNDVSKLFGLSLLRDYLRYFTGQESHPQRLNIREALLNWVRETFQLSCRIEAYVMNNIASVLTLCIKCDFPENWSDAFEDILSLSRLGWMGIDLCVRIFADLDAEVIVFSESRAQEEISHNRAIKDAMREGTILFGIVNFLTTSISQTISKEELHSIAELCLSTLAAMIGWIDITLIVNDTILPQIYQFIQFGPLSSYACNCLLEITKKGMNPTEKVRLIASIGLVNIISDLPFNPTTCDEETIEDDIGTVIDVIFVELMGCWIEFENYVLNADMQAIENSPIESESRRLHQQMGTIGQITGEQLKLTIPVLMKVFSHAESVVSATVISALKKLVAHIKKQQPSVPLIEQLVSEPIMMLRNAFPEWFFIAADYIPQILSGIYLQLQYPVRFYESSLEADEEDEEIAAEVEAKNQMRQLFVSCCRICPTSCLQLIGNVLSSLSQPLYKAPFSPLEAALRLVYSFGESGTQFQALVNEGVFPNIIEALHQSEIHRHRHPMVLIAYYDVATRYASQSPIPTIQRVVEALVSPQGLRNSDGQLKCRSAFFIKKLAETLQSDSALLLQSVGSFADLIVTHTDAPPLPEQAEMHLLEAIGLMTSARSQPSSTPPITYNNDAVGLQLGLLQDLLTSLVVQLQSLLEDPHQVRRYGEQLSEIAAWKFGSLGSLTKGHTPRSHGGEVANLFHSTLVSVLPVICEFAKYKQSRNKSIIYLHRMVQCIGYQVLDSCSKCLPIFIEYADASDLDLPVQLLNQLMAEFGPTEHSSLVIEIANELLVPVVDRLSAIYLELRHRSSETDQTPLESGQNAETSLEAEKLNVLKNYLIFLQYISTYQCHPIFLSPINIQRFPDLLNNIVSGIRGGEDDGIRVSLGLSLRRASLLCLTPLITAWLSSTSSIPPEAKNLLSRSICDEVLPIAFRSFSNGSLNVSDPQAQAYIGDTATLIWTLISVLPQETKKYLVTVLFPSLGWHPTAINEMTRVLNDIGQVNTFRESLKKLIRKLSR